MIRRALLVALIAMLALPGLAAALSVQDVAEDVRCPTCNTPLNVSNSAVAQDMKALIARRIEQGWTKQQIIDELVAEFGPTVLATPPKSGFDLIAWIVPALAVAAGLCAIPIVARMWHRRSAAEGAPPPSISDDDRRRLDERLGPPL